MIKQNDFRHLPEETGKWLTSGEKTHNPLWLDLQIRVDGREELFSN